MKTFSQYVNEAKSKLNFYTLDNAQGKGSAHARMWWNANIDGKSYTWNYVKVKNGKWEVCLPEEAEAIALSEKDGKKLKTAMILKK
jgi:hypothetical protein